MSSSACRSFLAPPYRQRPAWGVGGMAAGCANSSQTQLERLVRLGLIRELFQQGKITQAQFQRLMELQRGGGPL